MAILDPDLTEKTRIDLGGPQGNAFFLLGAAERLAKDSNRSEQSIAELMDEMRASDYENLIQVFDREFGDIVDLVRPITDEVLAAHCAPRKRSRVK